ncbi:hypothetical protein LBMAG51_06930 [Phycisphaerae bacterium]|nr:hypothetical protein LBMAG51_06930 [Phycisphaerae bacterium]
MKDTKEQRGWKSALSKAFTLVAIAGIFYWLITTNKPVETVALSADGVPSAVSPPDQTPQSIAGTIRTKSVRAKKNPSLEIAIDQPAFVAPYYRVSLFPQAAGIVTFIEKSIGDKVTAGERLVEIQVTGDGTSASSPNQTAIIRAPFDGVVAVRGVDAGTFVQNAVVVPGVASLMTIERSDIVTVSMFVPENFVAFVDKNSEVIIHIDALPGIALRAKVSRLAPSLRTSDRTVMAEVDLYNGTAAEFEQFATKMKANDFADLKSRTMPSLPILPENQQNHIRLLPGMYGQMQLLLPALREVEMLPSQVVARRGGVPYIYVVEDGKAKKVLVTVEFDDGTQVRIRPIDSDGKPGSALPETTEYVLSNQGELSDGQAVATTQTEW